MTDMGKASKTSKPIFHLSTACKPQPGNQPTGNGRH